MSQPLPQIQAILARVHQIEQRLGQLNQSFSSAPQLPDILGPSFQTILDQELKPTPQGPKEDAYDHLIETQARKHGLDPALVEAVVKAESAYNPQAISPVGAQGLMQLMPQTAAGLGVQNSFDPEQNIAGGTQYLSSMLQRFKGNTSMALAAYNAGPGAVEQYQGIPPYRETQSYVKKVMAYQKQLQQTN